MTECGSKKTMKELYFYYYCCAILRITAQLSRTKRTKLVFRVFLGFFKKQLSLHKLTVITHVSQDYIRKHLLSYLYTVSSSDSTPSTSQSGPYHCPKRLHLQRTQKCLPGLLAPRSLHRYCQLGWRTSLRWPVKWFSNTKRYRSKNFSIFFFIDDKTKATDN